MKKIQAKNNNCKKYVLSIIITFLMATTIFSQNNKRTYLSDVLFVSIDGDKMRLEQEHSIDISLSGKNLIMDVMRNGVRTRRYNAIESDDEKTIFHITSIEAKYGKFYPQNYTIIMRDYTIDLYEDNIRVSFSYLIKQ